MRLFIYLFTFQLSTLYFLKYNYSLYHLLYQRSNFRYWKWWISSIALYFLKWKSMKIGSIVTLSSLTDYINIIWYYNLSTIMIWLSTLQYFFQNYFNRGNEMMSTYIIDREICGKMYNLALHRPRIVAHMYEHTYIMSIWLQWLFFQSINHNFEIHSNISFIQSSFSSRISEH